MVNFLRFLFFVIILSLVTPTKSTANEVNISNEIGGFLFVETEKIPSGPSPNVLDTNCEYFSLSPDLFSNDQTQSISRKGWAILSEVKYAQYLLIGFAGNLEAGTSGSCLISQSNIAVFRNSEFLGIIYLESKSDTQIGELRLMDGGFIRIFSGSHIQMPVADIRLVEDRLKIELISEFTSYCSGKSLIPNVYGMDIREGRKMLFELGYQPTESKDRSLISWREYLVEDGISEVEACSGTGFAFCRFAYENDGSHVALVTAGENNFPTIVRTMIDCKSE